MFSYLQLASTTACLFLNTLLIYLIIFKSSKQTGKYKYLMMYSAVFEIIWGVFDLPAEVGSYTHGHAFFVYRIDHSWTWLSSTQSTLVVIVYSALIGVSMAIFGAHFTYRYCSLDKQLTRRITNGWRFSLFFLIPIVFGVWWALTLALCCWPTEETEEYSRAAVWEHFHVKMDEMSYVSALFYGDKRNGSFERENGDCGMDIQTKSWIGAANMMVMTMISMFCIFFFGYRCYRELYKELSTFLNRSRLAAEFQQQLFYALLVQTLIPLVLINIPLTIYLLCPMLDLDYHFASDFLLVTIMLYPAIDPLPSFFIIKNYRNAVIGAVRRLTRRIRKQAPDVPKPPPSSAIERSVSITPLRDGQVADKPRRLPENTVVVS